jgi:hypothetical protein
VPEVEGLVFHTLEFLAGVRRWVNVAAAFDPVALDHALAEYYQPPANALTR